jgi:transcriptional regulator with XRE-family HTH domain
MVQVKHRKTATRKSAATNARNFRTFLLVSQFEGQAIGARIALARREAGLTQEQVGDIATFSKRSLQDYEAGVTIPWPHMREISALLGKPVEWFLHGEPDEISTDRLQGLEDQLEETLERLRRVEELLRGDGAGEEPPQPREERG